MVKLAEIPSAGDRTWAGAGVLPLLLDVPARLQRRMSGGIYRPEIDGLRFFAIAIVIVGHITERTVRFFPSMQSLFETHPQLAIFEQGGLGVLLFFTISGFIIATQARKAKASPLSPAFLKAYYGRRILRIEPPYMILLIATWLVISVTGYRPEGANQFNMAPASLDASLLGSLLYVHGLVWGTYPRLFPPGWSLEAEVQFYLFAPVLFWIWFRLRDTTTRVLFGLAVLLAGNVVSTFTPQDLGPVVVDRSILRFFHFFWLGIILADANAWIAAQAQRLPRLAATLMGWAGLAGLLLLPLGPHRNAEALAIHLAAYGSIALMFASALAVQSGFRRFCAWPWISLIGGACYSLYLVHLQVIQVLTAAAFRLVPALSVSGVIAFAIVAIAGVVAAGLVYYAVIERFFMIPHWPSVLVAQARGLRRDAAWKTPAE